MVRISKQPLTHLPSTYTHLASGTLPLGPSLITVDTSYNNDTPGYNAIAYLSAFYMQHVPRGR